MTDDCQSFRQGPAGDTLDIEVSLDSETNQKIIYWSDILVLFPKAHHVKRGNAMVTFLRNGGEWRTPHRIKFYPGDILEVVTGDGSSGESQSPLTAEPTNHFSSASALSTVISTPGTPTPGQTIFSAISLGADPHFNLEPLVLHETATASATTGVATSTVVATSLTQRRILKRAHTILQSSSAQLLDYERASQSSVIAKIDAIVQGNEDIQQGIEAIQDELRENFPALRSEIAKNTALQQELATVQQEMLKLQKRSIKMQQEALEYLALIQNKVAAIMTQSYELHEYPIPRLFIVLPKEDTSITETLGRGIKNLFAKQFKLYFLCECGDHTKPSDGRPTNRSLKHEVHIARHEGYDIDRPTEFFEKYGSYILTLLQMLKYGVAIAGVVVLPLAQLKIVDTLVDITEGSDHVLQDLGPKVDSSIAYIVGLAGVQNQLSSSDSHPATRLGLEALEGADLRQLESFLKSSDESRVLGNLYRVVTPKGHVKWVCLDHYRESYRAQAAQDLRDAIKEVDGAFSEDTGYVSVWLKSPDATTKFYPILAASRSIQHLCLGFHWAPTMQDLRDLRDAIKSTSIVALELKRNVFTTHAPFSDLHNISRRSDPILQIMAGGNIQSLTLSGWNDGFLERVSTIPSALTVRRFSIRSTEDWLKRIPRLISILQASPLLSELAVSYPNSTIDDVVEILLPALKKSALPQALMLEIEGGAASCATIEVEANTCEIQSINLRLYNSKQTNLLYHPLVRNIHIFHPQPLSHLLDAFQQCLKKNTGLKSVRIESFATRFTACLESFQALFNKYPEQTPRFCFSDDKEVLSTGNIQDLSSTAINVWRLRITPGYFDRFPSDCSIEVKVLSLDQTIAPADVEALEKLVENHPERFHIPRLNIDFSAQSDPAIWPPLNKLLKKCDVFQDTKIDLQLDNIGSNQLFSDGSIPDSNSSDNINNNDPLGRSFYQDSFKHLLQHYMDHLFLSKSALPADKSPSHFSIFCRPFRRLRRLSVLDLHTVGDEELAWILAGTRRDTCLQAIDLPVSNPAPGHDQALGQEPAQNDSKTATISTDPTTAATQTSTAPVVATTPAPPRRLNWLDLNCTMTDAQWTTVIESIDILTLENLRIWECKGFTHEHLAALVDRCISTAAQITALTSFDEDLPPASQPNDDPWVVNDLTNRKNRPLDILIYGISPVTTEHIEQEKKRLSASSIEWVQFSQQTAQDKILNAA
ncbi:hypothetical protein EC991_002555 [Linnemannia zychae]|nr:hypothetical protein EC991_002555 [Linnemannia zychae]